MIWAIDALQSNRKQAASKHLVYPIGADETKLDSKYAVHKWELETLANQLFLIPKDRVRKGKYKITNCTKFDTGSSLINCIRSLEDTEFGMLDKRISIFQELHRIGHRQFPWQRGYANAAHIYRYVYIYGQGECAEYFEKTHGLTVSQFLMVGFACYASLQNASFINDKSLLEPLGITKEIKDAALKLLCAPIFQARHEIVSMVRDANTSHGSRLPVAYQPSYLRRFPIISFDKERPRLRAPLPTLILARITNGLYYDLVGGRQKILDDANKRFEIYAKEFIARLMPRLMPRFELSASQNYHCNGNLVETPDVLVKDKGRIEIVVECKATKLTFAAQFSDDPVNDAKAAYDQIVKGVYQLWRYFSHVRRGFISAEIVSPDARGVVLTLDSWLQLNHELREEVLVAATEYARKKDRNILKEDRRAVIICPMSDLEKVLMKSDEDAFLNTISEASKEENAGWNLSGVFEKNYPTCIERKPLPFALGSLLPWWGQFADKRKVS
ncbi:hypothetical protein A9Q96_08290 [Rhodobacterales bacterium 52_120_T64]|nr:hypothetical protein A9Q96_08290 [Rhodobacterales bacterium 52_120_T64]